jgi:hypothetical protein
LQKSAGFDKKHRQAADLQTITRLNYFADHRKTRRLPARQPPAPPAKYSNTAFLRPIFIFTRF